MICDEVTVYDAKERWQRSMKSEEDRNDAISRAWELAQRGDGNPVSIAWYAVLHVRIGRQFRQSIRSIDGPPRRGVVKPQREHFDVYEIAQTAGDPADVAAFRIDFTNWFDTLSEKQQYIADALASGERTKDLAAELGVSWPAVSWYRRQLEASWEMFTA